MTSSNKIKLQKLIDIMSEHIPDINNYFTYNGKPLTTKITFDNPKQISKIYYKSSSLNQFIKEIKTGKHGFILNQYNKSCIQESYNNISNSKCMSVESYNNDKIKINIINKSLNINPQIIKFSFHNNYYEIFIEDNQDNQDNDDDNELSNLELIAKTLKSSIKSDKINDKIVSDFFKLTTSS
jgi:hypothetical protein